jgi:hypothetical protein
MAAWMGLAMDECVRKKEALIMLRQSESLHLAFSAPRWPM